MCTSRHYVILFLFCILMTYVYCIPNMTVDDGGGLDHCLYIPDYSTLDCSNNQLRAIPSYNKSFSNVTDLNLSRNDIEEVRGELNEYSQLTDLDISINRISLIDVHPFKNLQQLKTLNISHNRLTSLGSHMFDGLTSLIFLSLDNNMLGDLENGTFRYLTALERLSLKNNELTSILGAAFLGLEKLKGLDLSYNHFKTIPSEALKHLPNLEVLQLESNVIREIPIYAFSTSYLLRELTLSDNRISIIHDCAFCMLNSEPMSKLSVLLLNQNKLKHIPAFALTRLPNVERLNFDQNDLERLHFQSFSNFSRLQKLSVSSMHFLEDIQEKAFYNLTSLQVLQLRYNKALQTINKRAFVLLPKLSKLFMDHNIELDEIPHALIDWSQLKVVDFEGSNISCTCKLEWIMDLWSMNISKEYLNSLTCSHPKKFRGFQVSHNPFRCKASTKVHVTPKDNKILYAFIISSVSFICLASCFMTIKFRNKICFMCRRHFKYRRYKDDSIFVVENEKEKRDTEEVDATSEGTPMTTVSLSDDNDPIM